MTESHLDEDKESTGSFFTGTVSKLEQLFDDPSFDTDLPAAANLLGVGRARLSQIAASGQLPFIRRKIGDRYRVFYRRTDIERRIAERYRHAFSLLPRDLQNQLPSERAGASSSLNAQAEERIGIAKEIPANEAKPIVLARGIENLPNRRKRPPQQILESIADQEKHLEILSLLMDLNRAAKDNQQRNQHFLSDTRDIIGALAKMQVSCEHLRQLCEKSLSNHLSLKLQTSALLQHLQSMSSELDSLATTLRKKDSSRTLKRTSEQRTRRRHQQKRNGKLIG